MVMSPFIAGSLGALIGLLIALVANLWVLPSVLRAQEEGFILGRKTVLASMSQESVARLTRFMYRIPMPVTFAFVGWFGGLNVFGGY